VLAIGFVELFVVVGDTTGGLVLREVGKMGFPQTLFVRK
jgi:hypothetical protein